MSKLFDQLKDAAREREGGILLDALARKQAANPAQAELPLPEAAAARLPQDVPPLGLQTAAPAGPETPSPKPPTVPAGSPPLSDKSPLVGVGLAAAIFAVAVVAWHAAPWRPPQKVRIQPETLKLDRKLDLDRAPPKGTTAPSRPS